MLRTVKGWAPVRPGFRQMVTYPTQRITDAVVPGEPRRGTWGSCDVLGGASPAAGAPLREVRALGAERRVVAVAGVEPGLVGQPVEELGGHVVDQGREVAPASQVLPTPPGNSESPVNRCGVPSGSSYSSAIEPGVWPDEVDHLEPAVADLDDVAVPDAARRPAPAARRRPRCPATVSAPVAATTSGSARWWSQCWWVVTTRRSPSAPTTLEDVRRRRRRRRSSTCSSVAGSAAGRRCCPSRRPRTS